MPLVKTGWRDKYILLDVSLGGIAKYFFELCRVLTSP